MKKTKKGFTIVELVIVIAVIGILTAILVPTFSNLISRSNMTADTILAKTLNEYIAREEVENDFKPETMTDVVDMLSEEYGYGLDRLKLKNGSSTLLWDETTNRIAIVNGDEVLYQEVQLSNKAYKLWQVVYKNDGVAQANQKYSMYLSSNVTVEEVTTQFGIDAGKSNVSIVNYVHSGAAQDVVIRTNGGKLTIIAPNDTVRHYNKAELVDIEQVASSSYHEYGKVDLAKIANGRIVLAEESKVGGIHAVATGTGDNAYFNDIAVAVVGNAQVPTLTRDSIAIDNVETEGAYSQFVLEVQTLANETAQPTNANTDYVWVNVTVTGTGDQAQKTTSVVVSDEEATTSTTYSNSNVTESATASSIATSVASNTESAVYVDTEAKLAQALSDNAKYIVITADFNSNQNFVVVSDTVIDGQNHKITAKNGSAGRGITIQESGVSVIIRDLTINGNSARCVQVNSNFTDINITLENVTVYGSTYAVNICGGTRRVNLKINNSYIQGWCAVQSWGAVNNIEINNSTLVGVNSVSYNADGWNDFGTLVVEGDTTFATTEGAENIVITMNGGKIVAQQTTGNKHYCVLINSNAVGNTVILNNVEFDNQTAGDDVAVGSTWKTNTLIIDGEEQW